MTPSPAQRLEASRARLRNAIEARRSGQRQEGLPSASEGWLPWLQTALAAWWSRHPLNGLAQVAADVGGPAARGVLAPEAERHPLRLVALAAGAGALVVALRPWRWLPQAALSSVLVSALWPHGGLQRWLSGGGLSRWLASGELSRLIAALAAGPTASPPADPPTTNESAMPPAPAPAPTPAAPSAANDAQADAAMSYTAPRPAPMATAKPGS